MKKIFTAVILAVFILSAQIAFAAAVDWNSVPKISSKAQLATYIENGRRKGQTRFYFTFPSVKIHNGQELTNFVNDISYLAVIHPDTNGKFAANIIEVGGYGTGRFIYTIKKEYPGTRVANAYLSREPHMAWKNLTAEEQKLYNIAVGIVYEANKRNSEVEKARYIHDEICKRVKEFKNENDRNKTAIGALIDGYAQCQGFSDAFYMLGRMAGLNIRRIYGKYSGTPHVWNWIAFRNGKSYCVDVTNGFNTKGTYLFCATKERMEKTHSCDWSIIPNLQ